MTEGPATVQTARTSQGAVVRALRAILRLYRAWSATRLPRCRFVPSCSAYADEALATHGAARGTWLALRRVVRCRPGGGFGYDPVPLPHDHTDHDSAAAPGRTMTRVG